MSAGPRAGRAGPGSILIVEDNQVNVLILRSMLRKFGYEPAVAMDGVEGVEMAGTLRPRLVLMDINMPRMDGIAAAAAIRDRAGAGVAIVAVTADATDQQRRACAAAGFEGLLPKPLVLDDLIGVVRRWIGDP